MTPSTPPQIDMRHSISDTSTLILDRRSISPEKYSGRRVHREIVEQVLQHGTWAPNHGMTQPWRFRVFLDEGARSLMAQLSEAYRAHAGEKAMDSKAEKIRLGSAAMRLWPGTGPRCGRSISVVGGPGCLGCGGAEHVFDVHCPRHWGILVDARIMGIHWHSKPWARGRRPRHGPVLHGIP